MERRIDAWSTRERARPDVRGTWWSEGWDNGREMAGNGHGRLVIIEL